MVKTLPPQYSNSTTAQIYLVHFPWQYSLVQTQIYEAFLCPKYVLQIIAHSYSF